MVRNTNLVFQPKNDIDLLIYVTLLSGFKLEKKFIGCSQRGPVVLWSAELHDLGAYPEMIVGRGTVVGE